MVKVRKSILHQDLMDMLNDYFKSGDRNKFNEFVDAICLLYQHELAAEYICKHYIVGDKILIPFSGKVIARSYIKDFRHSWPFKSGGELK